MTNNTSNILSFTVSFNKKRWGKDGTCYTQTVKLPYELKEPLLNYLKEELASGKMNSTSQFYVETFVKKLETRDMEAGGWYAPSLTPTRYIHFFLINEALEGRVTGKRDISWDHNTALIFV